MNLLKWLLTIVAMMIGGAAALAQAPTTKKNEFPWANQNLFKNDKGLNGLKDVPLGFALPPADAPAKPPESIWEWFEAQWKWFWAEKAQLPVNWLGNHKLGRTIVLVWNFVMEFAIVRSLLVLGALVAIGAGIREARKKW